MDIPNFKTMTLAQKIECFGALCASHCKTFAIHPAIQTGNPDHRYWEKDGNPEAKVDRWTIHAPFAGCGYPAETFPTFEKAIEHGIVCAVQEHNAEYHQRTKKTRLWTVCVAYRSKRSMGVSTLCFEALGRRHAMSAARSMVLKDKRRRLTSVRVAWAQQGINKGTHVEPE